MYQKKQAYGGYLNMFPTWGMYGGEKRRGFLKLNEYGHLDPHISLTT